MLRRGCSRPDCCAPFDIVGIQLKAYAATGFDSGFVSMQVKDLVLQCTPQTLHYESFTVFLPVLGGSYFFISAKNFCEIRCIGEV